MLKTFTVTEILTKDAQTFESLCNHCVLYVMYPLNMLFLVYCLLTVKATVFDSHGNELSGERGTSTAFSGEGANSDSLVFSCYD